MPGDRWVARPRGRRQFSIFARGFVCPTTFHPSPHAVRPTRSRRAAPSRRNSTPMDLSSALRPTIATGEAWYFSRSRRALWRKGETSGHAQRVVEMRIDCDQDAVWIKVEQEGAGACHTGRRSCFYRAAPLGKAGAVMLEFRDGERTFDPNAVYGKKK